MVLANPTNDTSLVLNARVATHTLFPVQTRILAKHVCISKFQLYSFPSAMVKQHPVLVKAQILNCARLKLFVWNPFCIKYATVGQPPA
jgi:hypothetical protein